MFQNEDFFNRKKKELGVSLNEVQKTAVLHTEGPLLLLASPGSGKTTTTIMRIGYLIEEKGINPARIKAVTFSKAAANDMKQRFKRFFPEYTEQSVDFSTIHSLAFAVVREYFYKNLVAYQIIEGNKDTPIQKNTLIKQLFNRFTNEWMSEDQLEELTVYISFIKNKMVPREDWEKVNCEVPFAQQIFQEYENYKKTAGAKLLLDFDDMLTIANEAFEMDAALLRKYQQRYDYVLTDESQDTSMVQHAIIEKLVRPHQNLYVVADDDQSIYTWRAAEPQYLLNFKQVYPNAVILMMEQNYRSSKEIVETANQFIKQNKQRYDKNMFTENPPDQPIVIKHLDDYEQQASYLAEKITGLDRFKDTAVLFRNNSSSILLVNEFERAGIPFYIKDHDNRFFSHWVVKDILNFMRLSFSDKRVDIFEQIYRKLPIFITKERMAELKQSNQNVSIFDQLLKMMDPKRSEQITECRLAFVMMRGKRPLEVMKIIRGVLGYDKALEKIAKNLKFNKDYLLGILHTLEQIARPLRTMEEFAARLDYLQSVIHTSKFKKNEDVVTLSTFHSSKGLEFKSVYMIDLIQGVIPTDDDLENTELLEEAVRLFYVGMTRAESSLELIAYKKQFGKSVRPSQFILDVKNIITPPVKASRREPLKRDQAGKPIIPHNPNAIKNAENLKQGITVKHRVFGSGTIAQLNQEHIEIKFQRETKKLSIQTCMDMGLLEIINE